MVRKDLYCLIQLELKSADNASLEPVVDSGYLCIDSIYELITYTSFRAAVFLGDVFVASKSL